jgi:hypothetical protein
MAVGGEIREIRRVAFCLLTAETTDSALIQPGPIFLFFPVIFPVLRENLRQDDPPLLSLRFILGSEAVRSAA